MKNSLKWVFGVGALAIVAVAVVFANPKLQKGALTLSGNSAFPPCTGPDDYTVSAGPERMEPGVEAPWDDFKIQTRNCSLWIRSLEFEWIKLNPAESYLVNLFRPAANIRIDYGANYKKSMQTLTFSSDKLICMKDKNSFRFQLLPTPYVDSQHRLIDPLTPTVGNIAPQALIRQRNPRISVPTPSDYQFRLVKINNDTKIFDFPPFHFPANSNNSGIIIGEVPACP